MIQIRDKSDSNVILHEVDAENLEGADLSGVNLSGAELSGANLSKAKLNGANLSRADMTNAVLRLADLSDANLSGVSLSGADMTGARLNRTLFALCDDLHKVVGLDSINYGEPCSLDRHTLQASAAHLSDQFLRGIGYAQYEVKALHRLYGEGVPYAKTADKVPNALKTALANNRCVLFLGSGASRSAVDANGEMLPHWGMMLAELLQQLQDQAPDSDEITAENQDLLDRDDMMTLSEWIDNRLGRYEFVQYLQNRLGTASNSPIHEILSSKPFKAIITTNYDNLIEDYWNKSGRMPFVVIPQDTSSINSATQALQGNLQRCPVIKAHGSWENPDTIIFGPKSYREIMFTKDVFRQFISTIFSQYTVLFVGFSFRDPNFQSVLQWIYTTTKAQIPTHYAFLENRGPVFKHYMERNYNIRIISYPAPNGDHSALAQMLTSL
ncbi:MAG: SIR2 family protein [Pyrinomonadaceae bacterium]